MWKIINKVDVFKIKKDKYEINKKGVIRNKETKKEYKYKKTYTDISNKYF